MDTSAACGAYVVRGSLKVTIVCQVRNGIPFMERSHIPPGKKPEDHGLKSEDSGRGWCDF